MCVWLAAWAEGQYSPTLRRPGLMAVVGAPSCCAVNMATGKQPRPKNCLSLRAAPVRDGHCNGSTTVLRRRRTRWGGGVCETARVGTGSWGSLDGMCRPVTVRDVEALTQVPGINRSFCLKRDLFKHRLASIQAYRRAVCPRGGAIFGKTSRYWPYR